MSGRRGAFLTGETRVGGARLEGLTAAEVSAFVLAECTGRSTRLGRDMTLALRSFLVFLHVDGVLAQSLAAAVPRVAGWRLAAGGATAPTRSRRRSAARCELRPGWRDRPPGSRDLAVVVAACAAPW
jgi:integrase/recombinase XerD